MQDDDSSHYNKTKTTVDVWQCPAWWPSAVWVRTLVLFFAVCEPK